MTENTEWEEAGIDPANRDGDFDEWQTVDAEVMIKFENIGDGFIARYLEMDPRNANGIRQAHFSHVMTLSGEFIADTAFLNVTRDMERKLLKVPSKAMTRVEWTDNLDTGHESGNPMRVISIQWKR